MADIRENPQAVEIWGMNGAVLAQEITLTTAGTQYALPSSILSNRKALIIYNNSGNTVHLGSSSVSTSTGYPLADGESFSVDIGDAALYAVSGVNGDTVRILEVS